MVLETIRLKEWETVRLSEYDSLTLQRLLDLQKRNIIKTSLTEQGILVTANSNVGFETNESFSLFIEPKVSSISMIKMIGFLHGFIPTNEENLAHLGSGKSSFLDLLILQWVDLIEKLSSKMRKNYVTIQNRESYIKGKINSKELAKQGVVTSHTPIEYQVLELDQPLNQMIKAGLLYFKKGTSNPFIINKVNLLLRKYTLVSSIPLSSQLLDRLLSRLTRLEEVYKIPLESLNWLLTVTGIEQGNQLGKSLWVNMNALFQNYLTKVFTMYVPEYRFMSEVSNRTIFKYENDSNPFNKAAVSIRPDLMVFQASNLIRIIDFKYKDLVKNNVSTSDLYQLSNYGFSIGEGKVHPIILYPSIQDVPDQKILVNIPILESKQRIILRSVNLVELERFIETGDYGGMVQFAHEMLGKSK